MNVEKILFRSRNDLEVLTPPPFVHRSILVLKKVQAVQDVEGMWATAPHSGMCSP